MNKKNYDIYNRIEQKTFQSALFHFVKEEYGFTMGNLAIERFCRDIEELVKEYYKPKEHIKAGQMVWYAVAEDEKPSYAKRITDTKMVPVVLTIVSKEDIEEMKKGMKLSDIRKKVMVRLHNEAKEQGGVLSELDTKVIIKMSLATISKNILKYEEDTGKEVPRRGTVHDMGRSLTHKRIICYKKFAHKYSSMRIARETNHSLEEVEKYIFDYRRVKYCLLKGMDEDQICFILKMSKSLVKEYIEIMDEIGNKELEKELENDLLDCKIGHSEEIDGALDDSELIDLKVSGGNCN